MKKALKVRIPTTYIVMMYVGSNDDLSIFHEFIGTRKDALAFFKSRGPGHGRVGQRVHRRILYKLTPVKVAVGKSRKTGSRKEDVRR